jgi:hypothetical protein
MSSQASSLSSTADLIEGHVDAVVAKGVHWRARLALTTTLSHFLSWSLSWSYLCLCMMWTRQRVSWMTYGLGRIVLQILCRRGSLRRLLVELLIAPGKSSVNSLAIFVFLPFSCRL